MKVPSKSLSKKSLSKKSLSNQSKHSTPPLSKVRLDKWLWAARFFKTRSLAKHAIEGGKVHCSGVRAKASKEIEINTELTIVQGWDQKTVIVQALSGQRRGAPEAALLYRETEESEEKRRVTTEQRKIFYGQNPVPASKPNKKERRQLQHIKQFTVRNPKDS